MVGVISGIPGQSLCSNWYLPIFAPQGSGFRITEDSLVKQLHLLKQNFSCYPLHKEKKKVTEQIKGRNLSAVISHLKRSFHTGNEQCSLIMVPLFILKEIQLNKELLPVAPWLWGYNNRVSKKCAASLGEVSQGRKPRHKRKETHLGSESESMAELGLGSQFLNYIINTLSTHYILPQIHSLRYPFIHALIYSIFTQEK